MYKREEEEPSLSTRTAHLYAYMMGTRRPHSHGLPVKKRAHKQGLSVVYKI